MFDEYDSIPFTFHYTLDVYSNDNIAEIVTEFIQKLPTLPDGAVCAKGTNDSSINILGQNFNQIKENENLSENIINTINKLKDALVILVSRTITSIGGKVHYRIISEKYDLDLGITDKWILVTVFRGYRRKERVTKCGNKNCLCSECNCEDCDCDDTR